MSFFTFGQNNSGGRSLEPAITVVIEADNAREAKDIAEAEGLYFNGVEDERDCYCCGDRWDEPWDDEADEVPSLYGKPITDDMDCGSIVGTDGLPSLLIVYK